MGVKLRKRENKDGTTTLYLDIIHNGERRREFLKQLQLKKPSNTADREQNKANLALAKEIAVTRAQQLQASDFNVTTEIGKKTIVVDWMQSFIDTYQKADKRMLQGALNDFKAFLTIEKKPKLTFGQLSEILISDFQEYLQQHHTGEGGGSYFKRFKKMVGQAFRRKLINNNPAQDVKIITGKAARKDTLTLEEIAILANTPTQNNEVRRAFLFSCLTGLRWIDVSGLKWSNINLNARQMQIVQSKTEESVLVSLNDTAIQLLENPGKPGESVFRLPSHAGATKTLKSWVKRAGINKNITWHNARHSFGTNLIYHGADVLTASELLGHTSLKHTQRYVKSAQELKERATDKLNFKL